jgi:hypothetical protein
LSRPDPLPFLALVLSILGIAGFIFLFIRDFNIYWLILSPVILVVYQFPAVAVFWIYKKKRERRGRREERIEQDLSVLDDREREGKAREDL